MSKYRKWAAGLVFAAALIMAFGQLVKSSFSYAPLLSWSVGFVLTLAALIMAFKDLNHPVE
ncbi:MAG: hypothetical protein ABFD08_19550 [Syntrophomonas sp.]